MTSIKQLLTQLSHCPSISAVPANSLYATDSEQIIFELKTAAFSARIATQGAQLLEYSRDGNDILWLSPHATFNGTSPIRGGIPLCLPWFGANRYDPRQAKHGFARNQAWQLVSATETAQEISLNFAFNHQADHRYAHNFSCEFTLRFNQQLQLELSIHNNSDDTIPFSFALHSYFNVGNKYQALVKGLDQHSFLDNTQQLLRQRQHGSINFETEVDRVYESCEWPLTVNSPNTHLRIHSNQMPTAIIWNPDTDGANNPDIQNSYCGFICAERGAAFANELQIAASSSYHANMKIETI